MRKFEVSYILFPNDLAKSVVACTDIVLACTGEDAISAVLEFVSNRKRQNRRNFSVKDLGETDEMPAFNRSWQRIEGRRSPVVINK